MITHGQLQSQSMFVINPNPPWMNQIRNFNWLTALVFVLQFQTCWSDEEDHRDCGRRWRRAGCPYVSFYWNNLWPRWKVKVRSLLILMEFVLVVLKKKKVWAPFPKTIAFINFGFSILPLTVTFRYLLIFLKFVQAVIPTIEYDYTRHFTM